MTHLKALTPACLDGLLFTGNLYQAIIESSEDAILAQSLDGIILGWNNGAEKLYGYTAAEAVGRSINFLVPPGRQGELEAIYARAARGERVKHIETERVAKDGTPLDISLTVSPLKDAEGNVVGVSAIGRDITERKRTRKHLEESASKYRAIFDTASDGIFIHDAQTGAILDINPAVTAMYGFTAEEARGLSLGDYSSCQGEFTLSAASGLISKASTGSPQLFEWQARDKFGRQFWVEVSLRQGNIDGKECVLAWVRDISERKQADEALRLSEETFRSIVDSSPTAMYFYQLEPDGTLVLTGANPASEKLTGLDRAALVGKTIGEAFPGLTETPYPELYRKVATGEIGPQAYEISYQDGRLFGVYAVNVFRTGPNVIAVDFYDITERKRAEEDRELAAKVFQNSSEGIAVTDIAGRIQRVNPGFTAITGYSAEEVVGQTPRVLKSDRHTPEFYKNMWGQLLSQGKWSGEIWNRRKSGEAYPEWLTISAVKDAKGVVTHYVSTFHDITETKRQQEAIEYLANHDALTGLPNRMLLDDRLEVSLGQTMRRGGKLALLYLDLDNFKHINDSLGHAVGDLLLQELAGRLLLAVRAVDTVSRRGGDEFIIVLPEISGPQDAVHVCQRIFETLRNPFRIQENVLFTTISIGVALFPDDAADTGTLIKNADMAMYRAKKSIGNAFHFFAAEMDTRAQRRMSLESRLRLAVELDELELYYQPVVDMHTGMITGAEALIRWWRDGSLIPPDEFIPLAEETGIILPMGAWVLATACRQAREWRRQGFPPLTLSVNISGEQFRQGNFNTMVAGILQTYEVVPDMLHLEITESVLMINLSTTAERLQALRDMGVKIMLDDFGTGYSSLAYLKRLPVDGLKIDRSFVRELPLDSDSQAIILSIISLARGLKLGLVAEGVETSEQLDYLRGQGCRLMQGYIASRPVPAADFEALVLAGKPLTEPEPARGSAP